MTHTKHLTIAVDAARTVSGILLTPAAARACYVFAHGAGAGMDHPFMASVANQLALKSVATLRYQFPYRQRGARRPDPPALCHLTVRAAVAAAASEVPHLTLFAGGKSFGGRMTSQAQALDPLPGVRGLVFFGFPLHPAGQPSDIRAKHLSEVRIPMLFLQGGADALADPTLLMRLTSTLGHRATLKVAAGADHSLHVTAKSGTTDSQVMRVLLEDFERWMPSAAPPR